MISISMQMYNTFTLGLAF